MANTLSSVEPSTKGWSAVGSRATTTDQPRLATSAADTRTATWPTARRHRGPGPAVATRVPTTSAGSTSHACSILAWNPTPTKRPASSSGHHARVRAARCHQTSATASDTVSRPSSIGWPNIDTKIGVAAVRAAATRPARAPSQRSTTELRGHRQRGDGALDHLGQAERCRGHAEEMHADRLGHREAGELVERHGGVRVEGPREEGRQGLRHRPRRGGVEGQVAATAEVPAREHRAEHHHQGEDGPLPPALVPPPGRAFRSHVDRRHALTVPPQPMEQPCGAAAGRWIRSAAPSGNRGLRTTAGPGLVHPMGASYVRQHNKSGRGGDEAAGGAAIP